MASIFVLAAFAGQLQAETIAITHADAWVGRAGRVEDATIVLAQGKIVSVVARGAVPQGARIFDAKGRPVTPAVMHGATQLGLVESRSSSDAAASSGPLGAAFDIQYALDANSTLLPLARADGLSRAMSYPSNSSESPFAGMGAVIHLQEGATSLLDKPQAAVFVRVGADSKDAGGGGSRSVQWVALRNALADARMAPAKPSHAAPHRPASNLDALMAVLQRRARLAILAERESDIREAVRLAKDLDLSVVIVGGAEAWRAGDQLAEAGIPVVMDPFANVPQNFDSIGARLDNAARLHAAGVMIAFTVRGHGNQKLSRNAGLALREGAGLAVAHGLPYDEALRAITVNPAAIWGIDGHYGSLAPGKDADIVIWDGDPLEPATAPAKVWIRGRDASLVTRQTLLRDRYHPSRSEDPMPPAYRNR